MVSCLCAHQLANASAPYRQPSKLIVNRCGSRSDQLAKATIHAGPAAYSTAECKVQVSGQVAGGQGGPMIIANCQTIERVYMTAGSDLYRARHLTDGMPVLLKLLPENAGAAQSARFKREYLLLRTLEVTGVAKALSLIDERGRLALVLED